MVLNWFSKGRKEESHYVKCERKWNECMQKNGTTREECEKEYYGAGCGGN